MMEPPIPSFEKINYSLRPAKSVERRILCELFSRLYPFSPVNQYGYLGFGSIYFTDFQLIHRVLGISQMLSIEQEENSEERVRLNIPLKCIELKIGSSGSILPSIDWSKRWIVWLDYDRRLEIEALSDIQTFFAQARSGSMIVISVNMKTTPEPAEQQRNAIKEQTGQPYDLATYRLKELNDRLPSKVPAKLKDGTAMSGKLLRGDKLGGVYREIIYNEALASLQVRNKSKAKEDAMYLRQVAYFHYKDGAPMMTVAYLICSEPERSIDVQCDFSSLPFANSGGNPFDITVPCLTPREIRYIDTQLPSENLMLMDNKGIPKEDISDYAKIYRFFPSFGEVVFS